MLTDKEKKELLEDANNPKIRQDFQKAAKLQLDWIKNHPHLRSLDRYIAFLDTYQKIFGPFCIKKRFLQQCRDFKL